jgi:hypothetical protein
MKPVINRQGNVIIQETRSFLPGFNIIHTHIDFDFITRYQMRTSEGIVYRNVFANSAAIENSTASCMAVIEFIVPEKNKTK